MNNLVVKVNNGELAHYIIFSNILDAYIDVYLFGIGIAIRHNSFEVTLVETSGSPLILYDYANFEKTRECMDYVVHYTIDSGGELVGSTEADIVSEVLTALFVARYK